MSEEKKPMVTIYIMGKAYKVPSTLTICEGCGACVSTCPSGAIDLRNHTDEQVDVMLKAIAGEVYA